MGIRGDYYRVLGLWAKHPGERTDHIECDKKYNKKNVETGANWAYFIDPAQRCEWYGKTKDGGGKFVEHGEHLTPYSEWNWGVGERENFSHYQTGLALYIWVTDTGHIGHHKTTCIDC
jgi:hypothetical protein